MAPFVAMVRLHSTALGCTSIVYTDGHSNKATDFLGPSILDLPVRSQTSIIYAVANLVPFVRHGGRNTVVPNVPPNPTAPDTGITVTSF